MKQVENRVLYVKQVIHPAFFEAMTVRPDIVFDKLENDAPETAFAEKLGSVRGYQIMSLRDGLNPRFYLTRQALAAAKDLLFVSTNGSGYDTVDVEACTDAGVLVVHQAGGNREAVAEHVVAMMLTLAKRLLENDRLLRREPGLGRARLWGSEIYGRTIGIVGVGEIGTRVAQICRDAFAMQVLAFDPYRTEEEVAARGATKVPFEELLRRADVVSVNCPRTPETIGLFDAAAFDRMQKHAYFVTTARGGIHDEAALVEALRAGRIAGAGIDVWSTEPPEPDHPLLSFDNVVATDHLAGSTTDARINLAHMGAEQLIGIIDGLRPPRIINPQVWQQYAQRFERIMGFSPMSSTESQL